MANRIPIIVDANGNNFRQLPVDDDYDLASSNISNVLNITVSNSTTANIYYGDGGLLSNYKHLYGANTRVYVANSSNVYFQISNIDSFVVTNEDTIELGSNVVSANYITAEFFSGDAGLMSNTNPLEAANLLTSIKIAGNISFNYAGNSDNIVFIESNKLTIQNNLNFNNDNLYTGNLAVNKLDINGNITANYFKGDGSLISNLGAFLQNEQSNIRIDTNGNIRISPMPNSNVFSISNLGADLTGLLEITSNLITPNNLTVNNTFKANFFVGDGSNLSNITASIIRLGNSNGSVYTDRTIGFNITSKSNVVYIDLNGTVTANDTLTVVGNTVFTPKLEALSSNLVIAANGTNKNVILAPTGTGIINVSNKLISNIKYSENNADIATKKYVDDFAQGAVTHAPCRVATTDTLANITGGTVSYNDGTAGVGAYFFMLNTLTAIDGVTLAIGDRVLVKNQVNKSHNGIYVYTNNTTLTRATDYDEPVEITGGDFVFIEKGTQNAKTGWIQSEKVNIIGYETIEFIKFSGSGIYTDDGRITILGDNIYLSNVATITPNTWSNSNNIHQITVNERGQLTNVNQQTAIANANLLVYDRLANNVIFSNIQILGTMSNLNVNGTITSNNVIVNNSINSNVVTFGANLTANNLNAGNRISANFLISRFAANASAQPNITSVGTLVALEVGGVSYFPNIASIRFNDTGVNTKTFMTLGNSNGSKFSNTVGGNNRNLIFNDELERNGAANTDINIANNLLTVNNATYNANLNISNVGNLRIYGGTNKNEIKSLGNGLVEFNSPLSNIGNVQEVIYNNDGNWGLSNTFRIGSDIPGKSIWRSVGNAILFRNVFGSGSIVSNIYILKFSSPGELDLQDLITRIYDTQTLSINDVRYYKNDQITGDGLKISGIQYEGSANSTSGNISVNFDSAALGYTPSFSVGDNITFVVAANVYMANLVTSNITGTFASNASNQSNINTLGNLVNLTVANSGFSNLGPNGNVIIATGAGAEINYTIESARIPFLNPPWRWYISNVGISPTLTVQSGDKLNFNFDGPNVGEGDQLWIKTTSSVTAGNANIVTVGVTNQGANTGTLRFDTTNVTPGTYYYATGNTSRPTMIGTIKIENTKATDSRLVSATSRNGQLAYSSGQITGVTITKTDYDIITDTRSTTNANSTGWYYQTYASNVHLGVQSGWSNYANLTYVSNGANFDPVNVSTHAVELIGSNAYIIGGKLGTTTTNLAVKWNVNNPASQAVVCNNMLPEAINHVSSATDGRYIYIIGGATSADARKNTNYIMDTNDETWTTGAVLPYSARQVHATYGNGLVYAGGGVTASTATDVFYSYNKTTNTWTQLANAPRAIYGAQAQFCTVRNKIYVYGGITITNQGYRSFMIYDVATNTWSVSADPAGLASPMIFCSTAYVNDPTRFDTTLKFPRIYTIGGYRISSTTNNRHVIIETNRDLFTYSSDPLSAGLSSNAKLRIHSGKSFYYQGSIYTIGGVTSEGTNLNGLVTRLKLDWEDNYWKFIENGTTKYKIKVSDMDYEYVVINETRFPHYAMTRNQMSGGLLPFQFYAENVGTYEIDLGSTYIIFNVELIPGQLTGAGSWTNDGSIEIWGSTTGTEYAQLAVGTYATDRWRNVIQNHNTYLPVRYLLIRSYGGRTDSTHPYSGSLGSIKVRGVPRIL